MDEQRREAQGDKTEQAPFRTSASTSQPGFPVQDRVREVLIVEHTAVGNGEEKSLAKVKGSMPSDGHPEISSPSQRKSKDQPGHGDARQSDKAFAGVPPMTGREDE